MSDEPPAGDAVKQSFRGKDLGGADVSGEDVRGADFGSRPTNGTGSPKAAPSA